MNPFTICPEKRMIFGTHVVCYDSNPLIDLVKHCSVNLEDCQLQRWWLNANILDGSFHPLQARVRPKLLSLRQKRPFSVSHLDYVQTFQRDEELVQLRFWRLLREKSLFNWFKRTFECISRSSQAARKNSFATEWPGKLFFMAASLLCATIPCWRQEQPSYKSYTIIFRFRWVESRGDSWFFPDVSLSLSMWLLSILCYRATKENVLDALLREKISEKQSFEGDFG